MGLAVPLSFCGIDIKIDMDNILKQLRQLLSCIAYESFSYCS